MPDEHSLRLFNRLSPIEEQGCIAGGERLVRASYIAASCHSTSTTFKKTEPINRKERAIRTEKLRTEEEIVIEV